MGLLRTNTLGRPHFHLQRGWASPGALPVPCQRAGGAGRGSWDGRGAAGDGAEGAALNGSLVGKPLPSTPGTAEQRAHLSRLRGCGQKRDCGRLGDRGETPRGVLGESGDGVPTGVPARGGRGWPNPGDSPPTGGHHKSLCKMTEKLTCAPSPCLQREQGAGEPGAPGQPPACRAGFHPQQLQTEMENCLCQPAERACKQPPRSCFFRAPRRM